MVQAVRRLTLKRRGDISLIHVISQAVDRQGRLGSI